MESRRYLGIDWGEKRIGLATGDDETRLALPFQTVSGLKEVIKVIDAEDIDILVVGSPKKMSGAAANNPLWLAFSQALAAQAGRPVFFLDERLTSLAADARGGAKKMKAGRDEIAAAIILQDFLDREEAAGR